MNPRWIVMNHPSPDVVDHLEDEEPTERFALQTCPRCCALTRVALALATDHCAACGETLEVAPFLA